MTERVVIEGRDLTVTHDQAKPDPKRKRPPRFAASPTTGPVTITEWQLTWDEVLALPNPYHELAAFKLALGRLRGLPNAA